jgi:hypothetical protein
VRKALGVRVLLSHDSPCPMAESVKHPGGRVKLGGATQPRTPWAATRRFFSRRPIFCASWRSF